MPSFGAYFFNNSTHHGGKSNEKATTAKLERPISCALAVFLNRS